MSFVILLVFDKNYQSLDLNETRFQKGKQKVSPLLPSKRVKKGFQKLVISDGFLSSFY